MIPIYRFDLQNKNTIAIFVMLLGLNHPLKNEAMNIINSEINSIFNSAATMQHLFMIYARGVVSTGFFIQNRCSDSSPIADYIEHKKSGLNKFFLNHLSKLVDAILKTGTSDLKVNEIDVKSLEG